MRVFWEKAGLLGLVYRLVGQGFSDRDIAKRLNLTELSVQACIAWILRFLGFTNRKRTDPLRCSSDGNVSVVQTATRQLLLRIATCPIV
jgi:DNA-binding NarL/FixJ family response regulator